MTDFVVFFTFQASIIQDMIEKCETRSLVEEHPYEHTKSSEKVTKQEEGTSHHISQWNDDFINVFNTSD